MAFRVHFHGGAGKVTGSNFLVEQGDKKVLIDCGIEQGADFCEPCVYGPFPYEPSSVSALIVTHAHLDHIGLIPKLVKEGFRGKIFMTPPTRDLSELILRDSADLLAQDAKRRGLPRLYDDSHIDLALGLVELLEYRVEKEVAPGISAYFRNTGHILGSASVRLKDGEGNAIAFTGDIGNSPSPLLPDFEPVPDADVLVMESVYGNKLHPAPGERITHLRDMLKRAIERKGTILIPAFSMERTQLMLYELSNFFSAGELPQVPVFLDSPLAIKVTSIYERWGSDYFKKSTQQELKQEGNLFVFPFLTKTPSREDSERILGVPGPKIIIAGAGMSHGGRIGRWEAEYLPIPSTTLLIVGYQAPGSPGRRLQEGSRSVRIHGAEVAVRAAIETLEGWSAHADRNGLLSFAKGCLPRAKTIFTALGEPASARHLAQRLHDELGVEAIAPEAGEMWELSKAGMRRA